jgi:hypothetical protein
VQELDSLEIVRLELRHLPGGRVCDVVEKPAVAVREVGDESDAGGAIGKPRAERDIEAIIPEPVELAGAEVVVADGPDESDLRSEASGLIGKDRRGAAGEWPDEVGGPVKRIVQPGAHDFDERFADRDDVQCHGTAPSVDLWERSSLSLEGNLPRGTERSCGGMRRAVVRLNGRGT